MVVLTLLILRNTPYSSRIKKRSISKNSPISDITLPTFSLRHNPYYYSPPAVWWTVTIDIVKISLNQYLCNRNNFSWSRTKPKIQWLRHQINFWFGCSRSRWRIAWYDTFYDESNETAWMKGHGTSRLYGLMSFTD